MKCDQKLIEEYLANRLNPQKDFHAIKEHIRGCPQCFEEMKSSQYLYKMLDSYQDSEIDDSLLCSLRQIPFIAKKKFSIFHLMPREFAFTAASMVVALYAGILFSAQLLSNDYDEAFYSFEYYEQISLVNLLEN
ncbi:MAG: hypothetical protein FWG98_12835 [Candidatus Cloacimonetes bacterium]|nr:hypothetical protein [Candidatus Cloacimonadota bacterium]